MADPFAPLSPKQISQQARQSVLASVNPVVRQIMAQAKQQEARQSKAISYGTQQFSNSYDPLIATQAQADNAYRDLLGGQGSQAADSLASQLKSQGLPQESITSFMGGAKNAAVAGGNTLYGLGSASLSTLLSGKAAARAAGVQQLNALHGQTSADTSKQIGAVTSQVPGMVQNLIKQSQVQEYNKAVARTGLEGTKDKYKFAATQAQLDRQARVQLAGLQTKNAITVAKLKYANSAQTQADKDALAQSIQAAKASEATKVAKIRANATVTSAKVKATANDSKIDVQRSKAGGYLVNGKGQFVNRRGQPVKPANKVPVAKSSSSGPTLGSPPPLPTPKKKG